MNTQESTMFERFFAMETAGGIMLIVSAMLAMLFANTLLGPYYQLILATPVEVRFGILDIAKPLLLWINDGLMAIFFFLVGLELKREMLEGELRDRRNIILPGVGAVGGMLVPALVYLYFNYGDPVAEKGWVLVNVHSQSGHAQRNTHAGAAASAPSVEPYNPKKPTTLIILRIARLSVR